MATRKQIGSILLKPSESGHAAEIAKRGGSSTIVDTSSGKSDLSQLSGRGGGSSVKGGDAALQAYQQEIARQAAEAAARAVAEAKAKAAAEAKAAQQRAAAEQIKNAQQKAALLAQIERVKSGRIQATAIRNLAPAQRQKYFQEQANLEKAINFQKQKESGKRLTPQAQQLVNKYVPQEKLGTSQPSFNLKELARQQDQFLQSTKKGVVDLRTEKLIETTAEQKLNRKFEITKKLEDFLSKRGLLNKEKYSAWEKNALKEVDKYQNTRGYKIARQFWLDSSITSNDLFIKLPTALVNLAIITGKGGIKGARNPRQTASYFAKELRSAQKLVSGFAKNGWKKYGSPKKAFDAIIKAYAKKKNLEIGLQKLIIKTIVKNKDTPKKIINKLKNLKASDIVGGVAIVSGTIRKTAPLSYYKIRTLPDNLTELVNKPKNILSLPKNLILDSVESIKLLRTSPSDGIAKIGSDYLTFKVAGGSIKLTGKVAKDLAVKLNPKFVGVAEVGAKLKLKGVKGDVTLDVVGKLPKESIKKQIVRAGTRTTAISSQADSLLGLFKRSKGIKKPLGEAVEGKIGKKATRLLKKLDNGKRLTTKEISFLNKAVRRAKSKGLLERSFFADPTGKIRPSRLGIAEKEASLKEFLSGKATLKKSKPQILLFENIKIQNFPKEIKSIAKKIKAGKKLTEAEGTKLLKFQLKKSGKFKPLGFVTRESEITLSPGEIIKRVKKVAKVKINGKYIDIISTKVVKPNKITNNLIKKVRAGKATAKELKSLSKKLKKETGFDYPISSLNNAKKYFPLGRKTSSLALSKLPSKRKTTKIKYNKSDVLYTKTKRPYVISSSGKPKFISHSSIKRGGVSINPRPGSSGKAFSPRYIKSPVSKKGSSGIYAGRGRKDEIRRTRKKIKRKTIPKKKTQAFNVFARPLKKKGAKKQPSLFKINKRPLTKASAQDLRNFLLDTSLARSGKIKKAKGKPVKPILNVPQGYAQKTKGKFRNYKIVKGKRKPLARGNVIEKARNILDTSYEKRRISLERRLKQLTKKGKVKRKIVRRSLPKRKGLSQAQLNALARGRRIRMNKLKKKR